MSRGCRRSCDDPASPRGRQLFHALLIPNAVTTISFPLWKGVLFFFLICGLRARVKNVGPNEARTENATSAPPPPRSRRLGAPGRPSSGQRGRLSPGGTGRSAKHLLFPSEMTAPFSVGRMVQARGFLPTAERAWWAGLSWARAPRGADSQQAPGAGHPARRAVRSRQGQSRPREANTWPDPGPSGPPGALYHAGDFKPPLSLPPGAPLSGSGHRLAP